MITRDKIIEKLLMFLISIWTFITPMIMPFLLIGLFDVIDFIVGVRASRKQGCQFTISTAMQRTIDKLTWQGASLIVVFLLQHFLIKDAVPIFQATYVVIIVTQAQSIRENIKILSGFDVLKDTMTLISRKNKS